MKYREWCVEPSSWGEGEGEGVNIAYSDEIFLCLPPGCYSSNAIYLRLNNKSVSLMSLRKQLRQATGRC